MCKKDPNTFEAIFRQTHRVPLYLPEDVVQRKEYVLCQVLAKVEWMPVNVVIELMQEIIGQAQKLATRPVGACILGCQLADLDATWLELDFTLLTGGIMVG